MPAERAASAAEILGADVATQLAEFENTVLELDLFLAGAELVEKTVVPMNENEFKKFVASADPELLRSPNWISWITPAVQPSKKDFREYSEKWNAYGSPSDPWQPSADSPRYWYCAEISEGLPEHEHSEAVVCPGVHMRLLGWWLTHAWRFVDLATTAVASLDSWNVTVAALASRALIEEVACLWWESDELFRSWRAAKHAPADARDLTIMNLLSNQLEVFTFSQRGLESIIGDNDLWQALNILTIIGKFAKRMASDGIIAERMSGKELEDNYAILSNAAHPAFGARISYAALWAEHDHGATRQRRLSRVPNEADAVSPIPDIAAKVILVVGGIGETILWQSLRMIDDFGLTTRTGLRTPHPYWRKLVPASKSSAVCPCGCGKWRTAQHRWGQPVIELRLSSPSPLNEGQ
ncbi:MAG: hypothetical protein K1X67_12235 [Fimbriimonadaceae bacterium]|nr:hypothetical protein [Fimbriimonadaceae bacterium]